MKRYYFEADRKQWEKPTEPDYLFCTTAKTDVYADNEEEARMLAEVKLHSFYDDSGILLDNIRLVDIFDVPADWSYGYGEEYQSGPTAGITDTIGRDIIR